MNMPMAPLEYLLIGAELMLVLIGLAIAVLVPAADRWDKRFFISFFSILVLYGVFGLADQITYNQPNMKTVQTIVYYFESLFCLILLLKITLFLHRCAGVSWRSSALFRCVAALWTILFVALNLSPFTDRFYTLSPDGQFSRGPLYPWIMVILAAMQVLNLIFAFRWRRRISRIYFRAFVVGLIPMIAATLIHTFVSVFALLGFGMTVCALAMLGLILFGQIDRTMRQQREIAHQRASIMVLQMRPHFIYNTMMSIYYLCKQDPDLAQQVTLDFTSYLRKNFQAIASEEPVPFSVELEHTRAYLAVEQAQFEDRLFIEYDTPSVDFRVPPLTLQPIVENAVKHGMDPDAEPLRILIRTAETDAGYEITVSDTGTGFVSVDDGEPHIALKNIRQRLELMCRGKMTIAPRPGGGTVVTVSIPRPPAGR